MATETLAEVIVSAGITCVHEKENPGQQTRNYLGNVIGHLLRVAERGLRREVGDARAEELLLEAASRIVGENIAPAPEGQEWT